MYGDGNGSGNGSGYGYGYGDGNGYGGGYGYGYGDGNGYGGGSGSLSEFAGHTVLYIDKIPTVLTQTKGFFGKGFIINKDYTTKACYVARTESNSHYAHGDTLKAAHKALQDKIFSSLNFQQRVVEFKKAIKDGEKYPVAEFSRWHYLLTGSCEFGRNNFIAQNKLGLSDKITLAEFFTLCKGQYGWETIKKLRH